MRVIPAGEQWFESESLSDGVYRIRERYVTQDCTCNIWLVPGRDAALLFDTGMGLRPLKEEVERLTEKPVICVASHAHFDHFGGHHEFSDRRCHHLDAEIMAAPTPENTLSDGYVEEKYFSGYPNEDFSLESYCVKAAPATSTLQAGDVIDLGDRSFEVLHLPGHAPGAIALWEEKSGLLFSGDIVYDGQLLDELYHSNKEDYRESLARLKEWPADVVHPGHYGSFGQRRLVEIAEDYLAGRRKVGCPLES